MEVVHLKAIIVLAVEDSTGGLGFSGSGWWVESKFLTQRTAEPSQIGVVTIMVHFCVCYMLHVIRARDQKPTESLTNYHTEQRSAVCPPCQLTDGRDSSASR